MSWPDTTRPETYDPDLTWDPDTATWVIVKKDSKLRQHLVSVGFGANGLGCIYFEPVTEAGGGGTTYSIWEASPIFDSFGVGDGEDLTEQFPVGAAFDVTGSTGNDGTYTVDHVFYYELELAFYVFTVEEIPDATADGSIGNIIPA